MPVEIAIPIAIFLVFLNGFFVAAEFSLVKIRHTRISELASKGGGAAKMALHAVNHLDSYLAATQLGITIASIGLGWVGEPAFAVMLQPVFTALNIPENVGHGIAFGIAFATISMLHIVLGELAPQFEQAIEATATAVAAEHIAEEFGRRFPHHSEEFRSLLAAHAERTVREHLPEFAELLRDYCFVTRGLSSSK